MRCHQTPPTWKESELLSTLEWQICYAESLLEKAHDIVIPQVEFCQINGQHQLLGGSRQPTIQVQQSHGVLGKQGPLLMTSRRGDTVLNQLHCHVGLMTSGINGPSLKVLMQWVGVQTGQNTLVKPLKNVYFHCTDQEMEFHQKSMELNLSESEVVGYHKYFHPKWKW